MQSQLIPAKLPVLMNYVLTCSRTMNIKRVFLAIVAAAVVVILIAAIAFWVSTNKRQSSAVVTNGLECAPMAG